MTVVIILDCVLYNCPVVDSFLSFLFDWLWILSVSLLSLFNRRLFLLIAGLKLKNSRTKWQSPSQNFRDKSFSLRKLTGFVPRFWIFDHTLSCCVFSSLHLCLSCTVPKFHLVPLRPLVGLRPRSNFFIHSLSTRSVQDTTPEGVLS